MAFVPPVGMPVFQASAAPYMDAVQQHYQAHAVGIHEGAYYTTVLPAQISCEIKPRLTKEQHDILEAHFQKQNKPNTNTKKGFAESLNVSLDKVNNWFQNRRAKLKQDAKKASANAMNMFPQSTNTNADTSPAFARSDYLDMMQQCASDNQHGSGLGLGSMPPYQSTRQTPAAMFAPSAHSGSFTGLQPPGTGSSMFNDMQETNRRTLTQEQFNALGHDGNMLPPSGQIQTFSQDFVGAPDLLDPVFGDMSHMDEKHEDFYAFSMPYGDGPSSSDSSVPSVTSEHSLFPPGTFSDSTNPSASPDDWTESRSASIPASAASESQLQSSQMAPATQHTSSTSSQWQPGQSKPVNLESLQQQFRDAHAPQQTMQAQAQSLTEEPLAWPEEDVFMPQSQNSNLLAQQMSDFALQTPQPPMPAHFKAPPPAASIAARRHVKRPAALGIASLRSTSYSGGPGPASPGQSIKSSQQPLRRIQSSVAMNSIAQGRVTKGSIGSAQRSPLNFTFSESVNSPKAMRHASSSSAIGGSLAPPTPLSPTEMTLGDQTRPQFTSPWPSQRISSRNTSVSELDFEHPVPYFPPGSATSQTFSSPPHTPMFNHQFHPFMNGHMAPHMMLENTPPQSAPASQLCFSSNVFSMPQQMMAMPPPPPPQMVPLQAAPGKQAGAASFVDSAFPANMASMQSCQSFVMPNSAQQSETPLQQALHMSGSVAAHRERNASVASAPDMQQEPLFVQSSAFTGAAAPMLEQSLYLPPQSEFSEFNFDFATEPSAPAQQAPQSETELSVHEYNPPEDIKQGSTPRKHITSAPKNWTFANQGPEHYEREKPQKGSVASSSPESHISSQ